MKVYVAHRGIPSTVGCDFFPFGVPVVLPWYPQTSDLPYIDSKVTWPFKRYWKPCHYLFGDHHIESMSPCRKHALSEDAVRMNEGTSEVAPALG